MRLIDADELKRLRDDYIKGKREFEGNEYDLIDKCPTVDIWTTCWHCGAVIDSTNSRWEKE